MASTVQVDRVIGCVHAGRRQCFRESTFASSPFGDMAALRRKPFAVDVTPGSCQHHCASLTSHANSCLLRCATGRGYRSPIRHQVVAVQTFSEAWVGRGRGSAEPQASGLGRRRRGLVGDREPGVRQRT